MVIGWLIVIYIWNLTQSKHIYLHVLLKTSPLCFYSISAKEERLYKIGNMHYYVEQTWKGQMLVLPGMAPTQGGESKSVIIQFVCHIVLIFGKG